MLRGEDSVVSSTVFLLLLIAFEDSKKANRIFRVTWLMGDDAVTGSSLPDIRLVFLGLSPVFSCSA